MEEKNIEIFKTHAKNMETIYELAKKMNPWRVDNNGIWVKIPVQDKTYSVGFHVNTNDHYGKSPFGISVNFNSLMEYEILPGTPTVDELLDKALDFVEMHIDKGV